jgi:hypothetical protein
MGRDKANLSEAAWMIVCGQPRSDVLPRLRRASHFNVNLLEVRRSRTSDRRACSAVSASAVVPMPRLAPPYSSDNGRAAASSAVWRTKDWSRRHRHCPAKFVLNVVALRIADLAVAVR